MPMFVLTRLIYRSLTSSMTSTLTMKMAEPKAVTCFFSITISHSAGKPIHTTHSGLPKLALVRVLTFWLVGPCLSSTRQRQCACTLPHSKNTRSRQLKYSGHYNILQNLVTIRTNSLRPCQVRTKVVTVCNLLKAEWC